MTTLLRMTAVLLLLSMSGIVHALDVVLDGRDSCGDAACSDGRCTDACGLCFCCPLRAEPVALSVDPDARAVVELVVNEPPMFAGTSDAADIFRPPRV